MPSQLEETLQHDIDRIRDKVIEMGELAESALRTSLQAITERNRKLAYSVILRDGYIDELEKEIDRLCQEFLVRQLPAGGHLRFVYAVIKINNELERIGDYAESIARQFSAVSSLEPQPSYDKFLEIANLSISMLRNAVQSFVEQNVELATATMKMEKMDKQADSIRYRIHDDLVRLRDAGKLPSEALPPLMIIASRFERVADQACNICEEVLFMCTGKYIKHEGKEIFRILFIDERDSCRAQMAEGIGNSLGLQRFRFNSAGISPRPVDAKTVKFMVDKGIDISRQTSKYLNQIPNLEHYDVIISLCKEAEAAFPPPPTKTVSIRWNIEDPSKVEGSKKEIQAAYEKAFQYLDTRIRDLIHAVLGDEP
ncbi:MAG: phosphate signaling complex protein PhoU, partial [bacterium]